MSSTGWGCSVSVVAFELGGALVARSPLSPVVSKASSGAMEVLPLYRTWGIDVFLKVSVGGCCCLSVCAAQPLVGCVHAANQRRVRARRVALGFQCGRLLAPRRADVAGACFNAALPACGVHGVWNGSQELRARTDLSKRGTIVVLGSEGEGLHARVRDRGRRRGASARAHVRRSNSARTWCASLGSSRSTRAKRGFVSTRSMCPPAQPLRCIRCAVTHLLKEGKGLSWKWW